LNACFLADLHAHTWKQFARTDAKGVNSRLSDLVTALGQVWHEARRRKVTDVYIAGDLVHVKRHVPVQAVVALYDALAEAKSHGLKVHLVPGNHDQVEDDPSAVTPLLFRDVADVHVEPDDSSNVVYCPWMFDQEKAKRFLKGVKGERELLIYHGEVSGAFVGPTDYPFALKSQVALADLKPQQYGWVMMGHLHRRQHLGRCRVYYIGNPISKDRGEPEGDKGAMFVQGDELSVFQTTYPKFVTLDLNKDMSVEELSRGRGNFLTLIVPSDVSKGGLDKIVEQMQPREVEIVRAPRQRDVGERRTELRIGMTLEELMDRHVDEQVSDVLVKPRLKSLARKLLEETPVEGASH
jgi:DNA repair exonuclease SbcCD nuclease subunit